MNNLIRFKNNPIINLNNVSNVFIDRKNNKVVFNMNYGVKIYEYIKSDFEYWNYDNLEEVFDYLDKVLKLSNFIEPNSLYNRYVNLNCVSSIKIDYEKFKIIFNLNSMVTHPDDIKKKIELQRFTSDYVFIKFNNQDEFYEYVSNLESKFINF